MASSRQSPKISAVKQGLALVPLLLAVPKLYEVKSRFVPLPFHLSMTVSFNISLSRSPSQKMPKLMVGLLVEIWTPLSSNTLSTDAQAWNPR
jgi:hypothetical protein